jgi:hypothetical protein
MCGYKATDAKKQLQACWQPNIKSAQQWTEKVFENIKV